MKSILFAAALGISSMALAQTQSSQPTQQPPTDADAAPATEDTQPADPAAAAQPAQPAQPSGETVDDPSQATGPQGITQQGTDPQGQATAPAGVNQPPSMAPANPGQAFAPRPAAGEYPPCSRTVTDNCIQTYERGVRRSRRGR